MIDIYGGETPNVFKAIIVAAELGYEYRRIPLDITTGEQFAPAFLAISPNNRVPAIVDHSPADGGAPLSVFESGAILLYLADKAGALLPKDPRGRSAVMEWLMWQMAGVGPMAGQFVHFRYSAPEPIPYAVDRYAKEVDRLCRVLDVRLEKRDFIAGDFSIADIACWPWLLFRQFYGITIDDYPAVQRWFRVIEARPAVSRVLGGFVPAPIRTWTDEERAILFGQKV